MRLTGAQALANVLANAGVRRVFVVAGNQINEILLGFRDRGLNVIGCRHEGGAALMAEGYARVTGEIGVCVVIPGPGVTNALSGLLEAYTACTPLLLISVRQASARPRADQARLFHGLDQLEACRPVTGVSVTARTPLEFHTALTQALAVLRRDRPRPVFLELAQELVNGLMEFDENAVLHEPFDLSTAPGHIADIADLVESASRPAIVAGAAVGRSRSETELHTLARTLGAPVLTTTFGKGVFPETCPDYVCKTHEASATGILGQVDLVIAVGTRFTQVDTNDWSLQFKAPLLHIDPDADEVNREYPALATLCGPLRGNLRALNHRLRPRKCKWASVITNNLVSARKQGTPGMASLLQTLVQPNDIVAVDVHELGYPLVEFLDVDRQGQFLFPGLSLALGYAGPAAIGASLAQPESAVFSFSGDGGLILTGSELATAVKHRASVIYLVANDSAFGTIRANQRTNHNTELAVDLHNPDFQLLAQSYGIQYARIDHPDQFLDVVTPFRKTAMPVIIEMNKEAFME